MKPATRQPAIILRRTNFGEADKILQLLTPDGRVSAIAKGVRSGKSKLAGGLELFSVCDVLLISGKGEIKTIASAKIITFFDRILSDYDRMQLGYQFIKQVSKASEQVDEAEFFNLLKQAFEFLNELKIDQQLTEVWFNLQLLILLGVGLNVRTDTNGMKLVEDQNYNFNEDQMAFEFAPNGRFKSEHIKLLRLLTVKNPKIVQKINGLQDLIKDCLWLVRGLIG